MSPAASRPRCRVPWAIVFVASAEVLLFSGALLRGETFAERDLRSYYRPAKSLVAPLWRASEGLPLWNPLFSSGQPFAANPEHEVFHPITALFLLLPFEAAFRLQVLLPPLAAAGAAYLLARTLRRSREAAALAAVAWGFGGYLVSTTNLLPILFATSILPAVLAFAIRASRGGGNGNTAGLAATTALVGLAGEPSTLLMLPTLVLAALLHGSDCSRKHLAALLRPVPGLVIGLALAAATLLPGLHHASKTARADGLPNGPAGEWSMPPVRVAELVSPHALGHVEMGDEAWYWGRSAYGAKRYPFLYSIYPGLCVSLLAALGTVRGWRRLWPWLTSSALGLMLAAGVHGPLWGAARRLPLLSGLRYPEKFVLLFALPLVVVAIHGFDWTLGPGVSRRRGLARSLGLAAALALAAAAGVSWADGRTPRPWAALGIEPRLDSAFAAVATRDAIRVALVAVAGLAALAVARRRRRWAALGLVALTSADLALAGRAVIPSVPVAKVARPPDALVPLAKAPPSTPLFHLAAEEPAGRLATGIAKPPIPAQWGIPMTLEADFDMTFRRSTQDARQLFWKAVQRRPEILPRLLERRSVNAVLKLCAGAFVAGGALRSPRGATDALELAAVTTPRPLVFPAERIVCIEKPEAWVDGVLRAGDEVSRTLCLDPASARDLPERPSPAEVRGFSMYPGAVSFEVIALGPSDSVLAVNQTWDEGWRLLVDGEPGRLLLADLALSAIAVRPGRHRVELAYRDPWVTAGLTTSGAAFLALVAALLVSPFRSRRPARAGTEPSGHVGLPG